MSSTPHPTSTDDASSDETTLDDHFEPRDWEGSTFDPTNKRLFSILPECDADEAYCVRHEKEIPPARVVLKHEGGLYATADDWDVYSCPECAVEVGPPAKAFVRQAFVWAFDKFDDTDTEVLDGAFKYVGEADDVDDELEVRL